MEKIEVNGVNYYLTSCEEINKQITEKDGANPFKEEPFDYLGEGYNSEYIKDEGEWSIYECELEIKDKYGLPEVFKFYEAFKYDDEDMITDQNFYI